ncbi:hypothetical protein O9929_23660 [Vibrio lentus]|nr:hypothetical protein [Vibrio lentus]
MHHATNKQYLDKNYAGIFIIWDKMFGTFAKEGRSQIRCVPEESTLWANPFLGIFPRLR